MKPQRGMELRAVTHFFMDVLTEISRTSVGTVVINLQTKNKTCINFSFYAVLLFQTDTDQSISECDDHGYS